MAKPSYEELEKLVEDLRSEVQVLRNSNLSKEIFLELQHNSELVEMMHDGFSAISTGYDVLYVNGRLCEMLGYEADEVLGRSCLDFLDDQNKAVFLLEQEKRSKDIRSQYEISWMHKEGWNVPTLTSASPVYKHGERIGSFALIKDITRQKDIERELRESKDLFSEIIDNLCIPTFVLDTDHRITCFNRACEELTGFREQDVLGTRDQWRAFYPDPRPVMADLVMEEQSEARIAEYYKGKYRRSKLLPDAYVGLDFFPDLSRTGKWLYFSASPLKDSRGKIIGAIETIQDVTERKQAEAKLKESEKMFRSIVEHADEMIYCMNMDGRFIYVSPKWKEILGQEPFDVIGAELSYFLHPDDQQMIQNSLQEVLRRRVSRSGLEGRMKHADGSYRLIASNTSVVCEGDDVQYVLGIARDMTEERELEEKLRRASKMEAVGTLAGGVAHDLNNILSGIVSYPDLLLMKLEPDSSFRKPLDTIKRAGERAAALVQDLLTLARRGVSYDEVVELDDVVREYIVSPEYHGLASEHKLVNIQAELEPGLAVRGSKNSLMKTLVNIVTNAAESIEGSGKVMIRTQKRKLDRPYTGYEQISPGEYGVLSVEDTGKGIQEEDIGRIFEPFYSKKKMGRSGSGLGMAVVWGTVKEHGGFVDLESICGKGTKISLYFPVIDLEISAKPDDTQRDYKGKGESIVVVDDLEDQRFLALELLENLGYQAKAFSSGEEAVDYMKDNKAELLLLDMILDTGMDGLDTFLEIRKIHPQQKAIIVSGYSETARVKQAQDMGVSSYLSKPYTLDQLATAVKEAIEV